MDLSRPALDPELSTRLSAFPLGMDLNPELLKQLRHYLVPFDTYLEGRTLGRHEFRVQSTDGVDLPVSVFRPTTITADAPCIYWLHGGGMVMGDRFANLDIPLDWLEQLGAVIVTIDYRLAPEASGTTLVERSEEHTS